MKKFRLPADSPDSFSAIGIATAEKDYRICFYINKQLGTSFSLSGTIEVKNTPSAKLKNLADAYIYTDKSEDTYYIIKNRQENFFVIPQMKQADYIILASPALDDEKLKGFKKALSQVSNIQSTFAIPEAYLKNIHLGS